MAFDLTSLLKDVPDLGTGREQIEYIKLDLIDEDPNNFYQLSAIDELAANIELCGLQQPIRVRKQENGRYMIVSGHRRRAAVSLLAQENPEKWAEVPCIIETDEDSPALQQLRLIFANSHTRKMSSAEISRQAEEVEKLFYQLKEEGYEFPGRMRDHEAQAVNASKSKLARLKVIRENLDESWVDDFESGKLTESQAYELAQMPRAWQSILQANWPYSVQSLFRERIESYHKKCNALQEIDCEHGLTMCEHVEAMAKKNAHDYQLTPCTSCCFDCGYLRTCKNCCPEAAGKKKELRDTEKQAKREADERQAERDRPGAEFAKMVYGRIGQARKQNNVSVKALYEAQQKFYSATVDDPRQRTMESGAGKYSPVTDLPFGFNVTPMVLMKVVAVADTLGCSIDYLLGRTDRMEIVPESGTIEKFSEPVPESGTIWHPVSEEPPVGKKLIWIDCDGTCDSGRYLGDERLDEYCVVEWKDARWWSYYPGEET
jgi:ParB family chromosome partitioning protein